uniref:Uncharacterized protein n=1 Tax=Romanomermis culicivorax TaxID=13658 RepID=A0A915I7Z3_ROMCU
MFFDCNFALIFLFLLNSRASGNEQQRSESDQLSMDSDHADQADAEYGNGKEDDGQIVDEQQQHSTTDHAIDQSELFHSGQKCDILELVRCFVDVLDDWAWHLWTFKNSSRLRMVKIGDWFDFDCCYHLRQIFEKKDNIAAVNESVCTQHTAMDKCVNQKDCSKREILDASVNISDILLQKTRSGTFLKGYYIAKFSCSAEGAPLVHTHRECLLKDNIGRMVATASHALELEFRTKMGHGLKKENGKQVPLC